MIKLDRLLLVKKITPLLLLGSVAFTMSIGHTHTQQQPQPISITEFNQIQEQERQRDYQEFKTQWFKYLRGEISYKDQFKTTSPYLVRRATEDYLIVSGGLKSRFALASKNNTFGLTFKRPVDEHQRKASFHRITRSIFMDIDQMSANEWLVLFIHEVAHTLDSELIEAIAIYNNKDTFDRWTEFGNKNISLNQLDADTRTLLDQWLTAGLNRGFLSEYRAWLMTYLVYEEALKDGLIKPDPWLEDLKKNKPQGLDIQTYIFRHLSSSWIDPSDYIFKHTFIQQALKELRIKLYNDPHLIKLGQFEKIILDSSN